MANISSYPLKQPKASDLIIFSETYDDNAIDPVVGNPTRSATIQSIINLVPSSGGGGGSGTVTSVSGTGTVSGLTLTGTVTSFGALTLGGVLSLTSANVTNALGFTPGTSNLSIGATSTTALAGNTTTITTAQATEINDSVKNNTDTYTATSKITQIVTLSQAQYDTSSKLASTLYIIL